MFTKYLVGYKLNDLNNSIHTWDGALKHEKWIYVTLNEFDTL